MTPTASLPGPPSCCAVWRPAGFDVPRRELVSRPPIQCPYRKVSGKCLQHHVKWERAVPTIYAAMTPAGAIAEVVLHDVPMPSAGHVHDWERDKASDLHLGEIAIPRLKLIDLTSTGLRRIGLYVHDLFGTESVDYPRTRDWGLYIWQNHKDAQGLYWMSVREKGCPVVMLFGDRLGSLEHIPSNLLE